jgi:hypothetical protein
LLVVKRFEAVIRLGNMPGKLVTNQLRDDGLTTRPRNAFLDVFAGRAGCMETCSPSSMEAV